MRQNFGVIQLFSFVQRNFELAGQCFRAAQLRGTIVFFLFIC